LTRARYSCSSAPLKSFTQNAPRGFSVACANESAVCVCVRA
jgi:hypothetical protein